MLVPSGIHSIIDLINILKPLLSRNFFFPVASFPVALTLLFFLFLFLITPRRKNLALSNEQLLFFHTHWTSGLSIKLALLPHCYFCKHFFHIFIQTYTIFLFFEAYAICKCCSVSPSFSFSLFLFYPFPSLFYLKCK